MHRLLIFALSGMFALGSAEGAGCDRACLKAALDQYLNAVVRHDPGAASLTVGYRQTENAKVVRPGNGVWVSAKALGKLQRRYFDTKADRRDILERSMRRAGLRWLRCG